MESQQATIIAVQPCTTCYLCGATGDTLYEGLKDGLFGAEGNWGLKKCPNVSCGLVWLDPRPAPAELYKAYETYYTHPADEPDGGASLRVSRTRSAARKLYALLFLPLVARDRTHNALYYLDKTQPGKLLDVGCGDGRRLAQLRARGWQAEGQEIDRVAAAAARDRYGLNVHVGTLADCHFPDGTFDAVTMRHVIEHVYDPVGLLAECRRILKPSGVLVVITPNSESFGHAYFGSNWLGLDPPRHLHVFSSRTLRQVARRAGFTSWKAWTTAANAKNVASGGFVIASRSGRRDDKSFLWRSSSLFQIVAGVVHAVRPNSGEECVLKARK
jgi:2-polyprenyl-3-methyl-5-hydroxy-6-metoxy-1,4-benzoquinol methylase